MQETGWTIVGKKKSAKAYQLKPVNRNSEESEFPAALINSKIQTQKQLLKSHPVYCKLHEFLKEIPKIPLIILGLGSLNDKKSLIQFALILLFSNHFTTISIYDPIVTFNEIQYLKSLNLIYENTVKITEKTVFYMIHCEFELYENVLKRNDFSNLIIIGNSFRNSGSAALKDADFKEIELSNDKDFIFNNTSIHFK
jgi:hypothetical protein